MSRQERSLREWIKAFDAGEFDSNDRATQIEAGWYDWFCGDDELGPKLEKLGPLVKEISDSPLIDQDKLYVWFKNNCPCYGDQELYDDIRLACMEEGEVQFTVIPRNPYGDSTVSGRLTKGGEFEMDLIDGKWSDVVEFFTTGGSNVTKPTELEELKGQVRKYAISLKHLVSYLEETPEEQIGEKKATIEFIKSFISSLRELVDPPLPRLEQLLAILDNNDLSDDEKAAELEKLS